MKTINVRTVNRLRSGVKVLGVIGVVGGITVNSVGGLFFSLLFMLLAEWLINEKVWLYIGSSMCILYEGRMIIGQAEAPCYVRRSELPKGFETFTITKKDREEVIEFDLFVPKLFHGGSIVPFVLKITCGANMNPGPLSIYCKQFKERGRTIRGCTLQLLEDFRQDHHLLNLVFGPTYATTMSDIEWVELIFKPALLQFLEKEFAFTGVTVKAIDIFRTSGGRCIIRERKER